MENHKKLHQMTQYLRGIKTLFLALVLLLMFLKHIEPVLHYPIRQSKLVSHTQKLWREVAGKVLILSLNIMIKHIINKDDLEDFDFVAPIVSKFKDY